MKCALILTMGLVVTMALVGCGSSNPAGPGATKAVNPNSETTVVSEATVAERIGLIGTWEMYIEGVDPGTGSPFLITFRNDGVVEVNGSPDYGPAVTVFGAYQVDGNKLILKAGAAEGDAAAVAVTLSRFGEYTYFIEGNALTLASADGTTKWVKV
jgi:hypothetical protein